MSPSFQRVTIAGTDLTEFEWSGNDHWFRLFLPPRPDASFALPAVSGRAWYKAYLAIAEAERPHCSNYTVAEYRPGSDGELAELDIDVVLHWDARGEIAGRVAIWATSAQPGSDVALLDQGPLFDPPDDAGAVHLVADETGLPAIRGILRSLDERMIGNAIIEVPLEGDIEQLTAPPGMRVHWVARAAGNGLGLSRLAEAPDSVGHAPGRPPGVAALAALKARIAASPDDYAFIVGESSLATEGRRALHRAGLPKSRITFSGYWKHAPAHA